MISRAFRTLIPALVFLTGIVSHASPSGTSCADLTALTIPDITIKSAALVPAGQFTPPGANASSTPMNLPTFCRVMGVATPTSDSVINFEVWIPPVDAWNGKFEGVGNDGFSGFISYTAMAQGLRRGYATASTDTGHVGDDLKFGQDHPEKIADWGYRAIHLTAETAKLIIRDYAGRYSQYSYFNGCNTGGHQALMEAQRFPADYNGIIAGDPAADRIHEVVSYLWTWISTHADGVSVVPQAKLELLTKSAVAACDVADGVKDGVIDDPRRCRFNPTTLICKGAETDSCLTQQQLESVQKVYAGVKNPRTGEQIFPGWPLGSEGFGSTAGQGWGQLINIPEPRRIGLLRYFIFDDPNWDWRSMDFDKDTAYADAKMGLIAATSHDLRIFQSRGGKLLMYTGWVDPILPAQDIVDYYESVTKTMGGSAKTQQFFRLFMVPGMAHCSGGPGATSFDMLPAIEQWVEKGKPPEKVIAARIAKGITERTRPLCPYPQVARWKGTGSTDDAANFVCTNEDRRGLGSGMQKR